MGLGQIGLSTAKYFRDKSLQVFGYDISKKAVEIARRERIPSADDWESVPSSPVYIICVSTSIKNSLPDLSALRDVSNRISERSE